MVLYVYILLTSPATLLATQSNKAVIVIDSGIYINSEVQDHYFICCLSATSNGDRKAEDIFLNVYHLTM